VEVGLGRGVEVGPVWKKGIEEQDVINKKTASKQAVSQRGRVVENVMPKVSSGLAAMIRSG
jgi:hypothetical protein